MFSIALKKKLPALVLSVVMLLSLVTVAHADTNGVGTTDNTSGTTSASLGQVAWGSDLVLFLTSNPDYILDNKELRLQTGNPDIDEGYNGMSVTKAYSQIFRRTYHSWATPEVMNSIIFMGRTVNWQGLSGGYSYGSNSAGTGKTVLDAHSIQWSGGGPTNHGGSGRAGRGAFWEDEARKTAHTGAGGGGKGVFKEEIVTYLQEYFASPAGKDPHGQIDKWVADASKYPAALQTWAYIAAGVEGEGISGAKGVSERWAEIFVEPDEPRWETTSLTTDGLSGQYLDQNGIYKQVAGYLDSLLSVAAMCKAENKHTIADQYINVAKKAFGAPTAFVDTVGQMEMPAALIFQRWMGQRWNGQDGYAVDYFDFWRAYCEFYGMTTFNKDFRTGALSNSAMHDDYKQYPLATKSPTYRSWAGENEEYLTADRLAQRLAMQKSPVLPRTKASGDVKTSWADFPAKAGLGPTSASLGTGGGAGSGKEDIPETIYPTVGQGFMSRGG